MGSGLVIVLIGYILIHVVEGWLTWINLKHLARHGGEIPTGFESHVDGGLLAKMRDYTIEQEKVGIFSAIFHTIIAALFLFGGLLNWYNSWVVSWGFGPIVSAILFFLLLSYAEMVVSMPFSLFTTFKIEEKYGFNKQTIGLWCADLFKSLLLSTVLYSVLLGGAFWLIDAFPQKWWLLTWLFFLVFSLFLLYISPYVIEPLFNKFSPIEDEFLEEKLKSLMAKAGLKISRVFIMDASKRSRHSNAYFSGIGKVKRIVLFDTLLEQNSEEELCAILAHEAGHWKKKHILKRLIMTEVSALIGVYVAFLLVQSDWLITLFNIDADTLYVKLLLIGFIGSLVTVPLKPISSWFSRKHEWQADEFAVELTKTPEALAEALIKLGTENLANLHPHPLYAAIYYSHPPLVQRVGKLMQQKDV